jgi:hypothetical protein
VIVYQSQLLPDSVLAESLVFEKLRPFRIKNNREFFKLDIEQIKKTIDEVCQLLLNCNDLSQISKLRADYRIQTKQFMDSNHTKLIIESDELTTDEYNHLKQKSQYQQLTATENAEMFKFYIRQIYQLDSSQILTTEFIDKYGNHKSIHKYINRCKMNHCDLDIQIMKLVKKGLDENKQKITGDTLLYPVFGIPFFEKGNFDDKHEFFDLLLCYMMLCQILGLKSLTQNDIKNFQLTGKQLHDKWHPYCGSIAEKIEVWSFKLRENQTKIIKKEKCLQWDNQEFLKFINSLTMEKMGLQIKIIKRDKRDKKKSILGLVDDFDNIDAPKLRQFRISDLSMEPPKGLCLL